MDKRMVSAILVILAISAIFVDVQPLFPLTGQNFFYLGVLGQNQTIGDYPTSIGVNKTFLLYGLVVNHGSAPQYFEVVIKLGNVTTQISNTTDANAPVLTTYAEVLNNNQSWLFPINLSINHPGTDLRILFELWSFDIATSRFMYTGLWNQIWITVA